MPMRSRIFYPELHDREWLRQNYAKSSIHGVARMLGCSARAVQDALARHDIPTNAEHNYPMRQCVSCWESFKPIAPPQLYCSPECKAVGRTERPVTLSELLRSPEHPSRPLGRGLEPGDPYSG